MRPRVVLVPLLLCAALPTPEARADWPPKPGMTAADMADPANWPNDPDYGFSDDSNGEWPLYSFIPDQQTPSVLRPGETAAGMSVDLAWRYTIGDPDVVVMVTDSGIEWDSEDLVDKIWLNVGELAAHPPTRRDGSPCAGGPVTPKALAGLDCNGDGIFTVSDYAATRPSDGGPLDRNGNGLLDAGDLVLLFSDRKDDDGNGYVDDIAGWDFLEDDNDPYDDTRYGHGTGEAKIAAAAADNGRGEAGTCPRCRILPARVGDSFIADTNDFAQALVYGVDAGVSVVNAALGGIDMTRFAQAALDHAYARGVLVVDAMADENARHHNFPATANHTLPVHAITVGGNRTTSATTFLAFNTCTNYGGQNLLSASGEGCSSEATARLAGIAGLVFSAARGVGLDPPLSPGEAQQLFISTADDIDVPESRDNTESGFYWSQKGFDQRFGYGRVNANTAVEHLLAGKIPPSIDIVSPRWFTTVQRKQGTLALEGTVSARRAVSYDVTVEWAPGVQPLDEAFHTVATETNVASDTVLGGDAPLAVVDLATIDTTHEPDPDSPNGENAHTVTLRIRAVAHYGGAAGDVPAILHRTIAVHDDSTLLEGFPVDIGESGEASPKLADVDGDGIRDIVYPTSAGFVHVFRVTPHGPVEVAGFPYRSDRVDGLRAPAPPGAPSYLGSAGYGEGGVDPDVAREAFVGAPAVADLDGDGRVEIVAATFAGTVHVIEADGLPRAGWPIRLPHVPSCSRDVTVPPTAGPCMGSYGDVVRGAFAAPVLVDLDGDSVLDVVQAAFDGNVYAWDEGGKALSGWPVAIHYPGGLGVAEPARNRILTTPAAGDLDGDGTIDLVVGSNETLGDGGFVGALYAVSGRGNGAEGGSPFLAGWPVTISSLKTFPLVSEGVPNSGVVGRFGGALAAVMHGNSSLPFILPADPGEQTVLGGTPANALPERQEDGEAVRGLEPSSIYGPLSKAYTPNTMFPLFAQPSLADLDQDGIPDVVTSGASLNVAVSLGGQGAPLDKSVRGELLLSMWSGKTGAMLPASPVVLEEFTFLNSQAIADLNGDDYPEVITGTAGYSVRAYDACGREPPGFPKFTGHWILGTTALGDLDGDHTLELVVGTRNGWLFAWHVGTSDQAMIPWESYHHDNRNTGNLEVPLEQGDPTRRAPTPLTVDTCAPPAVASLHASGGCGRCAAGPAGAPSGAPALASVALLWIAGAVRRRRR